MKFTKNLWRNFTAMKAAVQTTKKEVTIKAPWGNIAALTWGHPSNPPVLLCHGRLDTCSSFRPLVSLLPDVFFYVSIDLPGNGWSDHMPKGAKYGAVDLVPTVVKVKEHFKWNNFMYIGHSLGVPISKIYDITHPGTLTRVVELDPLPAHITWPCTRLGIKNWFHALYQMYDNDDKFNKLNGGLDTAPKYTYEKAQQIIMQARKISKEASVHVLERCLSPAGEGHYSFTYDQRFKEITLLPFSGEALRKIYTSATIPTFCIISKETLQAGFYDSTPFIKDENAWPNKNYKFKIVEEGHDVHLINPDSIADDISNFLLKDIKDT